MYVGFELWIVNNGTIFDNILVTDDKAYADKAAEATWKKLKDGDEKAAKDAWKKLNEPEEEDESDDVEDDDEEEHDEL